MGLPLLIAHDFDVYGFQIAARLVSRFSKAPIWTGPALYDFEYEISPIDIGLRLETIQKYDLPSEENDGKRRVKSVDGRTRLHA